MPNKLVTPAMNTSLQKTPIAIIGLASIFPKAENLQQYWNNIIAEVDCVTDVPPSRWKIDDYYDPDPKAPDKTYCKRGGFMPDIDFNPMEFGLPPNILEVTDVSQLLSLVVAKQAMKDAGYADAASQIKQRTGVILGVGGGQKLITPLTTRLQYPVWDRVLENSGIAKTEREKIIEKMKLAYIPWEENSFPGMLGNVIAGRIANRLDLGGTNCVVDAACAASLAAAKMAVSELLEHRADTMITGGVDTDNSIFMYMSFSKTPAFSRNNDIRPFDVDSDGMMIGEGIGMLVLKRLADAERDNDRIYAVIRGIGTSSDGKYKSIYAPRAAGQSLAVSRAYEDAGFSPASVGLIEAHGTGTSAGDPTEFAGLNDAFSQNNPKKQYIALGSVKSQIGHTKAAAGSASLIKTALALHHKILPPTLNVSRPNPKMDIENSPFYLNTHTRPWIRPHNAVPRRAGVSAFGFGGTNFHFVLEEYNGEHQEPYRLHSTPRAVYLAAETPDKLLARCEEQLALLQSDAAEERYADLLDASQLLIMPVSAARVGFINESLAETREFLKIIIKLLKKDTQSKKWTHPKGIYYRKTGVSPDSKVVALFPGQGSQYLEMGKELALNFPTIRQAYGRIDSLFIADQKEPLSSVIFPIPGFDSAATAAKAKLLERTEYAQPAIGALSYGLYKLMQLDGFSPDFVAGHSFGELTALWAGGVINDDDYFYLIKARGQAMSPPNHLDFDAGTMLAVKGNAQQLQAELNALPNITLANLNSNTQVVLAGPTSAIQQAQQYLSAKGYSVTPLPVSAAFHTPLVEHAQRPFARAIERTTFNSPAIPVYANSTGQPHPLKPRDIQVALEEHILKPVLFQQEIENIYAAGGRVFVEIGPRSVLSNLVKDILGDRPHLSIALNATRRKSSDRQLREAYVQLRVAGLPLRPADPYSLKPERVAAKKARMTVKISGHNYVSPKTQGAFEKALQNGKNGANGTNGTNGNRAAVAAPEFAAPAAMASTPPAPNLTSPRELVPATFAIPKKERHAVAAPPKVEAVTVNLPPLPAQASGKPSRPHHPAKARDTNGHAPPLPPQPPANTPTPLSQASTPETQPETPKTSPSTSLRLGSLEKNLTLLHRHQDETLRVHEAYLKNQEAYSQSVIQLMQQYYGRMTAKRDERRVTNDEQQTTADRRPQTTDEAQVSSSEFQIAADRRPPTADEGQRTNDKGQMTNDKEQIVNRQSEIVNLQAAMLEIVSEKTGYPAEMLELEMDMEADLGIDSIKRVEILGAMQDRYPDLPSVNPDELAELRTLGQIVERMGESANGRMDEMTADHQPLTADEGQRTNDKGQMTNDKEQIVNRQSKIANQTVRLKTLPPPDFLEFSLPEGHICLLTDDGTQTTAALAQLLLERGWRVAVLAFPQAIVPAHSAPSAGQAQSSLPEGVSRITLADMSEAHLQQRLAEISADVGPVGAFIHLSPTNNQADAAKTILKHIFLIAKHLKPSLDEAAQQGRACFITAARLDGALGLSGELDFNPIDGGLFGLTKTLNLEWPGVFCRAVDLHPGIAPEHAAQYILAELHDPNRLLVEVGYGNKGRVTLTTGEPRPQIVNRKSKIVNRNSVFVVSGGGKGITAQCAIEAARQHRCKFILLGRSSVENVENVGEYSDEAALKRLIMETLLAKGEKPTPVRVQQVANATRSKQEIEATLQSIQQAGGQAEYLSVDVADAAALQTQLSAATERLGPVTGVIHGAGVLSDKLIEKKTEQDFEKVYAVKVQGLQALLQAIPPQQLDHLILFSSAAGFYGNVGQADYALSNEILNKTAHLIKRQHPSCHVVSINWGPWDGGMVTPALKERFAERNIEVIPLEVGTRMLVDELSQANHDVTQTVVGGPLSFSNVAPDAALRSYRIHRALSLEANPFLYDHIIGEHPVLPTVNAIAWMGNVCEQLYPGYKMFSCDNYQVLKGIVFDEEDTPAKFYTLDLEEVNKTDNEVVFKALIWSSAPNGKPRYHYRAQVTLMQTLPDAPIYGVFDNAESQPITKAELYQNGTLFHGPSFQGVERVLNISPQKVTMRCVLPEISPAQQGQFPVQTFNPFIADGQFQSLVIWARHFHQAGSLPLQARQGEQYRPIPFGETSFVSMEVRDSADTKLVADIITHDAEGRVYARVLGAEVTISKQLNHLFKPGKNGKNGKV